MVGDAAGAVRSLKGDNMLIITIEVDAPAGHAIGVKEAIAQDLERYGDVKVTEIKEIRPQQERLF